jgi:hypothetical protein
MNLVKQLEGFAHLHDRRMTALKLADDQPEKGRAYLAEWAGLSDAEEVGFPRRYSGDPVIQAHYERGFGDGQTILYVHGALRNAPCVAA